MTSLLQRFSLLAAGSIAAVAPAVAQQCDSQWLPGDPLPTPKGDMFSTLVWDADGPGGMPARLVATGSLSLGAGPYAGVFTYDGAAWNQLGSIPAGVVASTVWNNQLLVAWSAGVTPLTEIRAWNGSTWQIVGAVNGYVESMAVFNNQPYIGGLFTMVEGVPAANIARWTGSSWAAVGSGVNGVVRAMVAFNNQLRVGGQFTNAGGNVAGNLAYWNGAAWTSGPSFNAGIESMVVRQADVVANQFLFVGGSFTSLSSGAPLAASRIARLSTGNSWAAVGAGLPARCKAIGVIDAGFTYELVAVLDDQTSTSDVWRYSFGAWSALGPIGVNPGARLAGVAHHGGRWNVGTSGEPAMLAWDGSSWSGPVGQGIGGTVRAIEPRGSSVAIGGSFTRAGGLTVNGIAEGTSNGWTPLGAGMTGGTGVYALATAPNLDLLAGGDFTTAGGVACNRVASWDGAAWSPLGGGLDGIVRALLVLPDGEVVAGGDFGSPGSHVAKWDGASWQPLGAGFDGPVHALALLPDGRIVAGGEFTQSGGIGASRIASWNGATWAQLGAGFDDAVFALALGPDDALHAGGRFTATGAQPCRLARWTGASWTPTPSSAITNDVLALAVHPDGDLYVGGGTFHYPGPFGVVTSSLMRIDPSGTTSMAVSGSPVRDIALPDGDVAIGGTFSQCDFTLSANYALYDTPCPAIAASIGVGCAGSAGPLEQVALEAPWLGGALRLRTTTFAPGAFGLQVLGYGTIFLPLPPVLPGALPGCDGLVTPDDLQFGTMAGGAMTYRLPVPHLPSLIGAAFYAQAVQFEASGGGLAISTSNATALVIGVL